MKINQAIQIINDFRESGDFNPYTQLLGIETPEQKQFTKAVNRIYQAEKFITEKLPTIKTDNQLLKLIYKAGYRDIDIIQKDGFIYHVVLNPEITIDKLVFGGYKLKYTY